MSASNEKNKALPQRKKPIAHSDKPWLTECKIDESHDRRPFSLVAFNNAQPQDVPESSGSSFNYLSSHPDNVTIPSLQVISDNSPMKVFQEIPSAKSADFQTVPRFYNRSISYDPTSNPMFYCASPEDNESTETIECTPPSPKDTLSPLSPPGATSFGHHRRNRHFTSPILPENFPQVELRRQKAAGGVRGKGGEGEGGDGEVVLRRPGRPSSGYFRYLSSGYGKAMPRLTLRIEDGMGKLRRHSSSALSRYGRNKKVVKTFFF